MSSSLECLQYNDVTDSKVEHIGKIPTHWRVKKLKFTTHINQLSLSERTPSSFSIEYVDIGGVSFEHGIETTEVYTFADAPSRARRLAVEGDTILSTVRTYLKAIATVDQKHRNCVYSTGFAVINPKQEVTSKYLSYMLKSNAFTNQVDDVAKGMSYPAINSTELSNLFVVLPPLSEQNSISSFLDLKVNQLEQAITTKKQQITLLKERKQIITQQAVTQGLNPDAPMKNSGVEWLGEIPKHWGVRRLKYVLDERNERSVDGEEPLLMVSQTHGLVVRADFHEKAEVAASSIDNKLVCHNDLVFNKLKAHLGVFFKSTIPSVGSVSPDYAVYKRKSFIKDMKLLELLFRHPAYIEQFIIRSTGIVEGLIRLYTSELFDIPVPIAPEDEQKEILEYIAKQSEKIDEVIALQVQQIEKLKEYKTTLINAAVTGKFKVA